jgi:hypothetical protein
LLWIVLGTVFSCVGIGLEFLDGVLFSISCMSNSGFLNITKESSDLAFFLVGVYTCLGIPIMGISFSLLVHEVISLGNQQELEQKLNSHVTESEALSMKNYGIVDGTGSISVAEYVILILLRLGLLRPDLIKLIDIRYREMQASYFSRAASVKGGILGKERKRQFSIQDINELSKLDSTRPVEDAGRRRAMSE